MPGKIELAQLKPLTIGKEVVDFAAIKASGVQKEYSLGSSTIAVTATDHSILISDNPKYPHLSHYNFTATMYDDPEFGKTFYWDIHTRNQTGAYLEGFPRGRELVAHAVKFLGIDGVSAIVQRWYPESDNYEALKRVLGMPMDVIDKLSASEQHRVTPALLQTWDAMHMPTGFVPMGVRGIRATDRRRYAKLGVEAIFKRQ